MTYLLLFYGLSFFLLGALIAFQARAPTRPLPARSMWLLAGFGFVHGAAEWTSLAMRLEGGSRLSAHIHLASVALIALSFALLAQFGIDVLCLRRDCRKWLRVIPVAILVALAGMLAASPDRLQAVEMGARYSLGLPGAVLAGLALFRVRTGSRRGRACTIIAGCCFIAYGIFAGLVGPHAPVIDAAAFKSMTGLPVELLRIVCTLSIILMLAEVFVIETNLQAYTERKREEFIAMVAHELRNSVSIINLGVGMLSKSDGAERDEKRDRAMLDAVRSGTRMISQMMDDLLDASRIEMKKLNLNSERIDLCRLVPETVEHARAMTPGMSVSMRVPEREAAVHGDPARIMQVLVNLLSNAAKYSPPGTEVHVVVEPQVNGWVTSVSNRGPGILPADLPNLFQRFYRTESAEKSGKRGLGLGLFIAKGIVEAHGGRIWAQSRPGEETTFSFALPASRG